LSLSPTTTVPAATADAIKPQRPALSARSSCDSYAPLPLGVSSTALTPLPAMRLRPLAATTFAVCLRAFPAAAQRAAIPTPASILGFEPGADRHLPSWKQITDYFTALDKASPRVTTRVLGKTTLGRPFLAVFISDSATLANLEHYRQIQRRLMDPRGQA